MSFSSYTQVKGAPDAPTFASTVGRLMWCLTEGSVAPVTGFCDKYRCAAFVTL